jgi:hypothetical protein
MRVKQSPATFYPAWHDNSFKMKTDSCHFWQAYKLVKATDLG